MDHDRGGGLYFQGLLQRPAIPQRVGAGRPFASPRNWSCAKPDRDGTGQGRHGDTIAALGHTFPYGFLTHFDNFWGVALGLGSHHLTTKDAPISQMPRAYGLLALLSLPILARAARLSKQAFGAPIMDATMGSQYMPNLLALHIVSASAFPVPGAFQFVPDLRRRGWHRRAGRIALLAGLLGSGFALTALLPPIPRLVRCSFPCGWRSRPFGCWR